MARRGRKPKIYILTENGVDYLKKEGKGPKLKGRGSNDHKYYQLLFKEYFEKGWGCRAYIEYMLKNKSVDVFVKCPNGLKIAVEIALNPYYEKVNIRKLMRLDLDQIIILCKNRKVLKTVRRELKTIYGKKAPEKIFLCLLDRFMPSYGERDFYSPCSGARNKREKKKNRGNDVEKE